MPCFHIRWFDSTLDWECHNTQAEAELLAQRIRKNRVRWLRKLVQLEEGYTIEKYQDGENTLPCPFQQKAQGA
jgi:hypothetical protein